MGSLKRDPHRVTVSIELSRLLKAPALLWDKEHHKWLPVQHSVAEVFFNLIWNRLASKHPELAKAELYGDYDIRFDPETQCIQIDLIKVSGDGNPCLPSKNSTTA